MKSTTLLLLLLTVLMLTATTSYAYSEGTITRTQDQYDINDATEGNPLIAISESEPYYGGTNNQSFITITNNYDETVTATIELSNNNWEFTGTGTTQQTVTLQPNESQITYVSIGGANKSCADSQQSWSYTYNVSGSTLTIQDSTNPATICGGPGGGGGGNGGNGGGPGGGGPPGQQ